MKIVAIIAVGLALSAVSAQAQRSNHSGIVFPAVNPAIDQVYTYGETQCRRMGLHLRTNMDTVFGVEDADGRGTPGFVVGPLECGDTANNSEDSRRQEFVDCRPGNGGCKQWFVLGERRAARMVWSGYTPTLSGVSSYLRLVTPACNGGGSVECPRVYWNGTTFTRQRPARTPARRRR